MLGLLRLSRVVARVFVDPLPLKPAVLEDGREQSDFPAYTRGSHLGSTSVSKVRYVLRGDACERELKRQQVGFEGRETHLLPTFSTVRRRDFIGIAANRISQRLLLRQGLGRFAGDFGFAFITPGYGLAPGRKKAAVTHAKLLDLNAITLRCFLYGCHGALRGAAVGHSTESCGVLSIKSFQWLPGIR